MLRLVHRVIFAASVAALAARPAAALEVRTAKGENTRIVIAADEVIHDNVLAAAQTVVVEGTVTGNLLAFGREVEIHGDVQGDVVTAAQTIEASGTVGGNWISFSRTLTSSSGIARSMAAFGERVEWNGEVEGDFAGFASELTLAGPVGNDAYAFAAGIETNSRIGGDLGAWTGRLDVGPDTSILGDLTARVGAPDQVSIHPNASIRGTTKTIVGEDRPGVRTSTGLASVAAWIAGLLAALVSGLVVYWLFPGLLGWRMASARGVAVTGGIGFLILVATPFAALVSAITIVGVPVSLMLMALWTMALYLAKIAIAPAIGAALLRKKAPPQGVEGFVGALALGLAAFWLVRAIPILGGLASFVVAIVGLGALGMRAYAMWKGERSITSTPLASAGSSPPAN